jgi:hypothetical protein
MIDCSMKAVATRRGDFGDDVKIEGKARRSSVSELLVFLPEIKCEGL